MIGRLTGTLLEKQPPQIVVDVAGVGYEVDVPMSSFYNLPAIGEKVTLVTHFVVREDAQQLYGFLTQKERAAFRELIRISGVGPKLALSVLSGLSVDDLASCVVLQEAGRLTKVPGIGKKTAERLLLELKGKLADALPQTGASLAVATVANDALNALLALGYSDREALPALKQLPEGLSLEESIRQSLKLLARK
ncbi:MAG: Holliday junction branch migration protein RuvA [Pseudomonadota bacterium]|nr:Holliday junction branch migration protein RuvA [Pseudomonadota bacterium]MDP1905629.1 Holliday junction branch migration protein RuvA [Pseudomonadota bacterium]MDP2353310.1 Holliday junction branch migration protein RuvA [Pseudomonadota bacterium]